MGGKDRRLGGEIAAVEKVTEGGRRSDNIAAWQPARRANANEGKSSKTLDKSVHPIVDTAYTRQTHSSKQIELLSSEQ